jgi:hypothetical protein
MADRGLTRIVVVVLLLLLAPPCLAEDWFGPPIVTTTPYNLEMVRAADLNRDGVSDVVVQVVGFDSLVAYRGDRDGRLARLAHVGDFGSGGTHQDYAFLDYWQDGQADLVLSTPWGSQMDIDLYDDGEFYNVL